MTRMNGFEWISDFARVDHGVLLFKNNECNSKKENDMKVRRNISHIFQVLFYL